jgi:hypothetical protein
MMVLSFFWPLVFSNAHKPPRIVSCPVSPSLGLRLPSRSTNSSGMISPSQTSSSHNASGPSTPQTCRSGTIPYQQRKQPIFPQEDLGMIPKSPKSPNGFQSNGSTAYQGPKHGQIQRKSPARHACRRDLISPENDSLANHNRRAVEGVPREFRTGKSSLPEVDCTSQQQRERDNAQSNAFIDHKSSAPVVGRGTMRNRMHS